MTDISKQASLSGIDYLLSKGISDSGRLADYVPCCGSCDKTYELSKKIISFIKEEEYYLKILAIKPGFYWSLAKSIDGMAPKFKILNFTEDINELNACLMHRNLRMRHLDELLEGIGLEWDIGNILLDNVPDCFLVSRPPKQDSAANID